MAQKKSTKPTNKEIIEGLEQQLVEAQSNLLSFSGKMGYLWSTFDNFLGEVFSRANRIKDALLEKSDKELASLQINMLLTFVEEVQDYLEEKCPEELIDMLPDDVKPEEMFL